MKPTTCAAGHGDTVVRRLDANAEINKYFKYFSLDIKRSVAVGFLSK